MLVLSALVLLLLALLASGDNLYTVSVPAASQYYLQNQTITIKWNDPLNGVTNGRVALYYVLASVDWVSTTATLTSTRALINPSAPDTGSYNWTIPANAAIGSLYVISIENAVVTTTTSATATATPTTTKPATTSATTSATSAPTGTQATSTTTVPATTTAATTTTAVATTTAAPTTTTTAAPTSTTTTTTVATTTAATTTTTAAPTTTTTTAAPTSTTTTAIATTTTDAATSTTTTTAAPTGTTRKRSEAEHIVAERAVAERAVAGVSTNVTTQSLFAIAGLGACRGNRILTGTAATLTHATGSVAHVANQDCKWLVQAATGTFYFAQITNNMICPTGTKDFLEVRNGEEDGPVIYSSCTTGTTSVATTSELMTVRFFTAPPSAVSSTGKGFQLSYTPYTVPSLTVTAPATGTQASYQRCTALSIAWTFTGTVDLVDILLYYPGATPITIAQGIANKSPYSWSIPCTQNVASGYRIIVQWSNPTRLNWWSAYCGSGAGCVVQGTQTNSFAIGYCTFCGDTPTSASSTAGMQGGQVAGIVIGVLIAVVVVLLILFGVWYKNKNGEWPVPALPSISLPKAAPRANTTTTASREHIAETTVAMSSSKEKPKSSAPTWSKSSSPVSGKPNMHRVDFDYDAQSNEELTIRTGEKVNVIYVDGEWAYGEIGPRKGFFPANYVSKI